MKCLKALSGSASVVALILASGPALAQSDQTMETVVVTGVRASLQSAQEVKKNSGQIMDSIVAEDIGKLPDNNVIEALQHVTGVQISRNAAEANQLLIRGLPDIATLMNGREIFTSTGRFMTLQDVPAELLARVDVHKSATAEDLEGGIAGLIDVRLHRPFDFDGLEIAGTARGTYSSLSGHVDPLASVLISDRFQTGIGEIGVLLDVSYSKDHYKEEILDNYISVIPLFGIPGAPNPSWIPLTEGAQSIPGARERGALDFSMQWRPNQNVEVFAEAFYTRYRNPNSVDFFVGLPWIGADPATATVFPGTNEVKTVNAGWYDLTSNQSFRAKTDTYQLASGATWTGENVTLSTEVDYTDSRFAQTGYILDTHYFPGPPPAYVADFNYKNTGTPYMNVPLASVTDPANMVWRQWYDQWTKQTGNEVDWRADLHYDVGADSLIRSFDVGFRYANRFARNRADNAGGLDCDSFPDPSSPFYAQQLARDASVACGGYHGNPGPGVTLADYPGSFHITSGSQFDGKFGITKWMDADPNWLVKNVGLVRTLFGQPAAAPAADPSNSFDDREQSYAGYFMAKYAFMLGGTPVDGNIGLRVVDTQADMRGNTLVITQTNPTPPPNTYSFTYTPTASSKDTVDWMPSLNMRFMLQDDLFFRLALSRTVTRPTFAQLNPGLNLSASTATLLGSGSSGNPDLTPEKSNNIDVSLEYYFGPSNLLSGTYFHRDVDGYIGGSVVAETIGGIVYQISRPSNSPAGHIDGFEADYTQFFDFLPGLWSGLGLQTNATYVGGAFQNISHWSYNVVGIYEKGPFSFRAAYNWRSGFNEGPAPGGGQNPGTIYAKAQPWLDLSASYRYTDSLTFTLDATNLLNSYFQDCFGAGALCAVYPRDTRRFDQTISLGLRYRL
ncbi:MAG: TonB-dependent receptor [Alphaproteobacteria bacterium]|nr:TonB-dependent receptor [Alphaproteobacteria bacterium]